MAVLEADQEVSKREILTLQDKLEDLKQRNEELGRINGQILAQK